VEFRILGPFEVVDNGGSLALGGAQQRALLVVLLLHRSEAVSTDRLVDQLWGERAPATAAKTVQGYVSQLRKVLGDGVILTQGRGYLLAAQPEQVDVRRFELLASEGRHALVAGNAARAREQLGAALGLWRGDPLGEFAYEPFAQNEIVRLQESRVAVYEDRIDADLALGRDAELTGEIEALVAANPLRERLRAQLMLSLYRSGRQAESLAVYRQTSKLLRDELGLEPGPPLKRLERMILDQDDALDELRLSPASPDGGTRILCPFKGLASFNRADADYFCGRERVISELLARLAESTLVGILGPSGIGKSSLLQAGVLPALSSGALPGSSEWRQVLMRPGEHPCAQLTRSVGDGGLAEAFGRLSSGDHVVVAVDQMEELLTVCESERERSQFLEELADAACDRERRVLVICSLRADFYGRIGSYPDFARLLSRSHVLVGPMSRDELAETIEKPAARAGIEVERPLVAALVSDVIGKPGGLPLLSTTLLELWQQRDDRTVRIERYRRSGGVSGAVARLGERAYAQLSEPEQFVARNVLLRLATGDQETLASRRAPLAELERLNGAKHVVEALADARLLTVTEGEVELSHEALLREWPRYRGWLDEDRDNRRLHGHLTTAAAEWDADGRDPSELYRGTRLSGALDWAAGHRDQLGRLEHEFITASKRRAEGSTRRVRAALLGVSLLLLASLIAGVFALRERQHATTEARSAFARQLGAEAASEPGVDLAMLLAREAVRLDPSPQVQSSLLTTLLRSPAVIGSFPLQSDGGLLALSPDGRTLAVSGYTPNGAMVAFYDPRTHIQEESPVSDLGGPASGAYSSDGSLFAYLAGTGVVTVRDAHTLALRYTLAPDQKLLSDTSAVDSGMQIAAGPRAVYLAYSHIDAAGQPTAASVDRWILPRGQPASIAGVGSGPILALRLTDGGDRLVAVTAGSVKVLDARSLRLVRSIATTEPRTQTAAAVSADGRSIVIGSKGGSVSFINVPTGRVLRASGGHSGAVAGAVFSPRGRTAITVGDDDRVIIWNTRSATQRDVLTGASGQVQSITISPDGRTLYTSSLNSVVAWDLSGDRWFGHHFRLARPAPCCDPVSPPIPPVAVSPDGSRFAVPFDASMVGVFSMRTLQRQAVLPIGPTHGGITALAWSPTGSQLAVAGHSGVAQLWNVDGAPRLESSLVGLGKVLGQPEAIQAIVFSADGRLVAASDLAQTPQSPGNNSGPIENLGIWQTATARRVVPIRPLGGGGPSPLAFSRTGDLLAVGRPDGGVSIIDASTGDSRRTLSSGTFATALAFAPDGRLAIGTDTGTLQQWNVRTGKRIAPAVHVAKGQVTSISFDPGGDQFATTGYPDGTVKLWFSASLQQQGTPLASGVGTSSTATFAATDALLFIGDTGSGVIWPTSLSAWEQRACSVARRDLTRGEWNQYLPGRAYSRICP
jgi:DNA-binding SARP family transcriptional activator/WD40 repeat protein